MGVGRIAGMAMMVLFTAMAIKQPTESTVKALMTDTIVDGVTPKVISLKIILQSAGGPSVI